MRNINICNSYSPCMYWHLHRRINPHTKVADHVKPNRDKAPIEKMYENCEEDQHPGRDCAEAKADKLASDSAQCRKYDCRLEDP